MYRDDSASLEERHRMLRRSLEENRARSEAVREEQASLHRELAALHHELGNEPRRPRRALPLANILIASPCDVPWDSMVGTDRVRHCAACKRDVHDLSAMTRDEAEDFLARADAIGGVKPCVSLFQRADGTILTADCPIGVRRRRLRALLAATMGIGALALMAFTALALLESGVPPLTSDPTTLIPVPMTTSTPAPALGDAHVSVTGDAASVYEDGKWIGNAPLTFTTKPGAHAYTFISGAQSRSETVVVPENGIVEMNVGLARPAQIVPPPRMGGVVAAPLHMKGEL
jgi:hypothetical protein